MGKAHRDMAEALLLEVSKGHIPPFVWVWGEDQGRITRFLEKLRSLVVPEQLRPFNELSVDCREVGLQRILELSLNLPMIGGHRFILAHNASELPPGAWEGFKDHVQGISPKACITFRAQGPPPESIGKIFRKKGAVLEFKPRSQGEALSWIRSKVASEGRSITHEAAGALVALLGTAEGPLEGEIQKLLCFVGEKRNIEEEDVQEACFGIRSHALYELTNAIADSRITDALKILNALLNQGVNPLVLVGLLARHLRQVCGALKSPVEGLTSRNPSKVSEYARDRLLKEARRWSEGRLLEAIRGLGQVDRATKTGRVEPHWLLENWILKFAPGRSPTRETH